MNVDGKVQNVVFQNVNNITFNIIALYILNLIKLLNKYELLIT